MKIVKRSIIRSITSDGKKAKTYVYCLDNNQIHVYQLILIGWRNIEFKGIAFKNDTFNAIADTVIYNKEGNLIKYREEGR